MTLPEILRTLLTPSEHHPNAVTVARTRAQEIITATSIDIPRTSLAPIGPGEYDDNVGDHPHRGEALARRLSPEVRHILRLSSGEYALYNARRDLCGIVPPSAEIDQLYNSIPAPRPVKIPPRLRTIREDNLPISNTMLIDESLLSDGDITL